MKKLNQNSPLRFESRLKIIHADSECLKAYEDAVVTS
jgi:hypothetical protein